MTPEYYEIYDLYDNLYNKRNKTTKGKYTKVYSSKHIRISTAKAAKKTKSN